MKTLFWRAIAGGEKISSPKPPFRILAHHQGHWEELARREEIGELREEFLRLRLEADEGAAIDGRILFVDSTNRILAKLPARTI